MAKIVVIGSTNTDMVIKAKRIPKPGETILGGDFFMNPGGKGANQAVAAARMGGKVKFVSRIGDDIFGKKSLEHFKNEAIDIQNICIDNNKSSGTALITVSSQGENAIVVAPGANDAMTLQQIDRAEEDIKSSDILLVQLEIPLHIVEHAIKKAKRFGKKIILNPAPAQKLSTDLLRSLYAITPNETEAELLTGIKVVDKISARKASDVLSDRGVQVVVITMGRRGSYVSCTDYTAMLPAREVEVVDTTAAGDTFNGALAVALAEGKSVKEAVCFANLAASLSVTKLGAQSAIPTLKEVLELELSI